MRTGDIDLAFDLFPDQVVQLNSAGFKLDQKLYPGQWFFEMDTRSFGPFGDKRVRQAVNYAVDKETIVKGLFNGFGEVAPGQIISRFGNGYNPDVKAYPYDTAKAKQLLTDAGYANGFKVRANITAGGKPFAEAVAGMLKEVGIEVDLQVIDFGVFSTRNVSGPIENLWGWRPADGPTRDADAPYIAWTNRSGQVEGRVSWRDQKFEELYTQQRNELEQAKRLKILQDMVALFREEAPVLFGYNPSQHYSLNPKIRDFASHPDVSIDMEKVYKMK
jgi:peptide/nickel transport system substrate-binding protein